MESWTSFIWLPDFHTKSSVDDKKWSMLKESITYSMPSTLEYIQHYKQNTSNELYFCLQLNPGTLYYNISANFHFILWQIHRKHELIAPELGMRNDFSTQQIDKVHSIYRSTCVFRANNLLRLIYRCSQCTCIESK